MNPGIKKLREYCSSMRQFFVSLWNPRQTAPKTDSMQRIFSYSMPIDRLRLVIAALSSVATGTTIPLMNIIFGTFSANILVLSFSL